MKSLMASIHSIDVLSPSMRREWIEISSQLGTPGKSQTSPSMRREWIEMKTQYYSEFVITSPSMRREWIEMPLGSVSRFSVFVSLHAEGVD